jgi:hypothetical protein
MDEQTVFNRALEMRDQLQRAAYLAAACGGDEALRQRVEALLALHGEAGDFLERSPIQQSPWDATTAFDNAPARSGDKTGLAPDFLARSAKPNSHGRIGQYEIMGLIGRGAMGLVLKAHDTRLNRTVAVKVLAPELAAGPRARSRFVREAQAAAVVVHPHVVTIHAFGQWKYVPYLVMECIDGVSLYHKIEKEGPLDLEEILRIGSQVADGLAAAHKLELVHRDVKPANILLEHSGQRVKITDFGLARAVHDWSVTRTGEVAGTPPFMSPEQAEGKRVDHRTDLFSLGSVLYTMCTGRSPFRADSTLAVMRLVCDSTPRPIRELDPEIPEGLVEIIERLLQKNPNNRFQSARDVSELLNQYLADLRRPAPFAHDKRYPVSRAAPGDAARARKPSRPSWWAAPAAVLVAVISLGVADATGVTGLYGTVIRWFAPNGTLIVEVDDPRVSVAIDGDDLVIAGAGVQEIRVKPGAHRVQARKDGKVVKEELVTVAIHGRQVVRVRREPEPEFPVAAWEKSVAALPAEEQVAAVVARLKSLNPAFPGTVEHTIDHGLVTRLKVLGGGLQDLAPIRALTGLQNLILREPNAKLSDLAPLKGMNLTSLVLHYSEVADLTPLETMKLEFLDCTASRKVADLSPLRGMPLRHLAIPYTQVADLSPLRGMKLEYLNCDTTCVSDLTPLEGMPLKFLHLQHSRVADLSPLAEMSLTYLDWTDTPVSDTSPLTGMPLEEVRCDFRPTGDTAVLRSLKTVKTINGQPAAEFWKVLEKK